MRLQTLFPTFSSGYAVSHTCVALTRAMHGPGLDVSHVVEFATPLGRCEHTVDAVPPLLAKLAYRYGKLYPLVRSMTRKAYLRRVRAGDVAYPWPPTSDHLGQQLRDRGATILIEKINCHTRTARRILAEEHARLGIAPTPVNEKLHADEDRDLAQADLLFCPSPAVYDSMVENNVPPAKLLRTSYGFDPSRVRPPGTPKPEGRPFTVVFVGSLIVRKGVHRLLRAWVDSGVAGRLILAGHMGADVRATAGDLLKRPGVEHTGFLNDVGQALHEADVFVLPTFEEGSPLVSYEAMAAGLPTLTTPMGAGEIVRDGVEGFVLDPTDHDAWVQMLRRLAADHDLRARVGQAAARRAEDYTWQRVGDRRRVQLLDALKSIGRAPTAA